MLGESPCIVGGSHRFCPDVYNMYLACPSDVADPAAIQSLPFPDPRVVQPQRVGNV